MSHPTSFTAVPCHQGCAGHNVQCRRAHTGHPTGQSVSLRKHKHHQPHTLPSCTPALNSDQLCGDNPPLKWSLPKRDLDPASLVPPLCLDLLHMHTSPAVPASASGADECPQPDRHDVSVSGPADSPTCTACFLLDKLLAVCWVDAAPVADHVQGKWISSTKQPHEHDPGWCFEESGMATSSGKMCGLAESCFESVVHTFESLFAGLLLRNVFFAWCVSCIVEFN